MSQQYDRVRRQLETTDRQLRGDLRQLRAIFSRLSKTQEVIGRAIIALGESHTLLAQNEEGPRLRARSSEAEGGGET